MYYCYEEEVSKDIYTIERFEAEVAPMISFYSVLRSFIRYSGQYVDKEALAIATLKKINELTVI